MLTKNNLPKMKKYEKLLPCLWNRRSIKMVEHEINGRDINLVKESWEGYRLNGMDGFSVLQKLSDKMGWSRANFLPQDDCFIFFKYFEKTYVDYLESVGAILYLEDIAEESLSEDCSPWELTLGELFERFKSCSLARKKG